MSPDDELLYKRLLAENGRPVAAGYTPRLVVDAPIKRSFWASRVATFGTAAPPMVAGALFAALGSVVDGALGAALGSVVGSVAGVFLFGGTARDGHGL